MTKVVYDFLNDRNESVEFGMVGESIRSVMTGGLAGRLDDLEKNQQSLENRQSEMAFELPKYILDAKGNRVWNEMPDENIEHKVGDIWFEKNGLYQRLYIWNGEMWEKRIDTEDVSKVGEKFDAEVKKINQSMASQNQQTAQALRSAGANASAIEAAKSAITKLNQDLTGAKQTNQAAIDRLKSDFASAQKTANDQTALLKSDLATIHTKQGQQETEIGKQVAALNATKTELAGVKSAQATFEQSTTRRLAELTNLADGKASKSELTQTAQELSSKIASVQVGGRNYIRGTRRMALASGVWASGTFRPSGAGTAKTIDVSNSPATGFDKAIRLTSSNARDQIGIAQDGFFISQGIYTMTCWVKGKRGQKVKLQTYWQVNDGISPIFTLSDENWTRLSFTAARDRAGGVSIGYVYLVNADVGEYLDVLAPQLEDGNIGTTPKEAPEDTDGQISAVESNFKQRADSLEAGVSSLREGLKTKADSSALTVLSDRISASVKSLETNTQNQLDSKLSTAEFDVRASGIRQEIVNATKDKADKILVTAEAGKLREEFSKVLLGNENLFILKKASPGYLSGGKNLGPAGVPNEKTSDFIAVTPDEKITFQIWVTVPKGGQAWRAWQFYTKEKELLSTRQAFGYEVVEGKQYARHLITVPANAAFIRMSARMYADGLVKVERSETFSDWIPSIEDAEGLITEAKATFERTAQGLRTDLSAVQAYVNADGTRSEALRTYSREETARQLTAERKAIEAGYVAKAQHTEDVRSISRRFEELRTGASNLLLNTGFNKISDVNNVNNPILKLNQNDYNGHNSIEVTVTGQNKNAWKGITLNASISGFKEGDTIAVRMPIYIFSDVPINAGLALQLKNHSKNKSHLFKDLGDLPRNKWHIVEFLHTFNNDADFEGMNFFYLYSTQNGHYKIAEPSLTLSNIIPSSWTPAFEDSKSYTNTKLAEYRQDVDGQLASMQTAINTANGSLTGFNTWKQSAQETLNKVGKVESSLNETKTSLAEFKRTAEGQLSTITQQVAGKANQTEFQRIQETSKLYERLIGSTEKEVTDKVSRMALTNELFQVEVSKNLGLRTVQYQIANAWAVQNLDSNGDIVSQINATGPNVRIQGESIHLDGKALIDNGIIKNAMIESMLADKITAGTLNAANVNIINLNASKIVGLDANFIKSKIELAFIEWMKGKVISAQNDAMQIDLNNGQYNVMTDKAAIRRVLNGYPNQFLKFTSETEGGAPASVTVLGANRDGTENSKNDSFAGIRLFSGNKVERAEIISDVVRFATGAVNYRGWEMRTLYGNDNRQVILQPFGNVTRSNIVANYFNGIDLVNVLETLNQMMANLGNHTGRHDIFGPIRGLGARKYAR